jgi:hypothetical protein
MESIVARKHAFLRVWHDSDKTGKIAHPVLPSQEIIYGGSLAQ